MKLRRLPRLSPQRIVNRHRRWESFRSKTNRMAERRAIRWIIWIRVSFRQMVVRQALRSVPATHTPTTSARGRIGRVRSELTLENRRTATISFWPWKLVITCSACSKQVRIVIRAFQEISKCRRISKIDTCLSRASARRSCQNSLARACQLDKNLT